MRPALLSLIAAALIVSAHGEHVRAIPHDAVLVVYAAAAAALVCSFLVQGFGRVPLGVAGALLLLATPSHAAYSQAMTDEGIFPVPFILIWAIGSAALLERPTSQTRWMLAVGMASLVAASWAQRSTILMLPVLAIATGVMFRNAVGWRPRDLVPAAGLALAAALATRLDGRLIPAELRPWLIQEADVRSMFRAATVVKGAWDQLLPSRLFFDPLAPAHYGRFLTPMVVPLAVGCIEMFRPADDDGRQLRRLAPVVCAPCLAALLASGMALTSMAADARGLPLVPFAIVIAVVGASTMWRSERALVRVSLGVCVAAAAIQSAIR